jgi:uncharacterized protein (DUF736 family)
MNAVVIEHVPVDELPAAWRERLDKAQGPLVTVRIEAEVQVATPTEAFVTDDPAFGIWRDRDDIGDATAYARRLRESRYSRDGSRNEP